MITDRLFELQDTGYRDFQSRLIPDIPKEKIIGVRTPILRKIAKELAGTKEAEKFINSLPHRFYEENNLHTFLVCEIKDYDACMAEVERFLPYIDNWATCDGFLPKVFEKHRNKVYTKIEEWIRSSETYTVRFAIVTLMGYLKNDFDEQMLSLVADIRSEEYYVNMAIAWYFSIALAKRYDAALPYLLEGRLDRWTHNKSIQKAIESRQIDDKTKQYLRTLKRR